MSGLDGKVAIVTGGGGGLGAGIAECLSAEGASLVISDIVVANAEKVAQAINDAGGKAVAVQTDVCELEQCEAMQAAALESFGRIDVLVCNAGVDGLPSPDAPPSAQLEDVTEREWDAVMDVNVKGVFLSCRALIPYFKEQKSGRIVNISSVAGRQGLEFLGPYAASKAAVISLSQSLALQLAPYHVNVNTVCPGIIWTPMWERLASFLNNAQSSDASPKDMFDAVVQQMIPFGKPQTIQDIGDAVAFLSSDKAKEITGQALNVCGGIRLN